MRCGWCVVQVAQQGATIRLTASLRGPFPDPLQATPAAEAYAPWQYVRHAADSPPHEYQTDCKSHLVAYR